MSLSPETLRARLRLEKWEKSDRKHWELYCHMLNPHVLLDALKLILANAGAAGVDEIECKDIKGHEWDFVVNLRSELKDRRYAASALRRVYIPKKDGSKRPLGMPTIKDRVVQRALVLLLEPIYEQVFLPCSYGFRPKRKSVECVFEVAKETFRHRHVLDADIEAFFDRVVHRKMMGMLKKKIHDPRILALIHGFLKSGFCEWGKPWQATEKGTPQGGPLSPMLANIYLHYALDEKFATLKSSGAKLFRFADDFVVIAKTRGELEMLMREIQGWLSEASLNLKAEKTRLVDMTNKNRSYKSKFDFLGFKLHLRGFADNPKRFWIARQPSEKSRKSFQDKLRMMLRPQLNIIQAAEKIRELWVGWSNYFRYGNSNNILQKSLRVIRRQILVFLRIKFRQQRRPVPWSKLLPRLERIMNLIRCPQVIPNPYIQQAFVL
jgi:RNA-directed DNA polymerase